MPSNTKENYLKAIYSLAENSEKITLSELSNKMSVSIPTVNNMVKRLAEEGWVLYQKYKPITLTESGRIISARIVRRHRLAEMFLVEHMGFGWEEVHDIAEELEHISSEIFFDKIDKLLDFPVTDPHGTPIPDKNGKIIRQKLKPLSHITSGKKVVLKALNYDSNEFLTYLNHKELSLDTVIEICCIEPFDGSMEVAYNDKKNIVLTKEVCDALLVEMAV